MLRSLLTSLATVLLVFAGFIGVAPGQQTGPLTPSAPAPTNPGTTAPVTLRQLYDALLALDPHVKCRILDEQGSCFFTLHLRVGDELRPVVVDYYPDKQVIRMVMPLSMPFTPQTHPISAEVAERIRTLNGQIAPCEVFKIPTDLEPDSQELVTGTVLKGPTTLPTFQARLKLLLESVATTKPLWSTFPQK